MRVEVGHESVHRLKVDVGIGIAEVAAHGDHYVVASVVGRHLAHCVVVHFFYLLVGVESGQVGVGHYGVVAHEALVVPETAWPAVVVLHCTRENLR